MFRRLNLKLNYFVHARKFSRKMLNKSIRVGLCQLNSRDDKEENFQIGQKLIREAKQQDAKVCLLTNETHEFKVFI